MIRGNLGCDRGDRLDIDPGLVAALLEIRSYNFGVRSINKILEPLRVAHKAHRALRRSQLPAPNQMSIHVDTDAFHHLCARDLPFQADEVAAKLAPAIHESWRRIARREKRKPKYDMAFEELPLDVKKSNEAAARRIPEILALVGLKLVPGRATAKERQAALERIDWHIEMLGAEEHAGWMAFLELEGWRYAPVRDDDKRLHDCLRPYHKLDEIDREKDRGNVRHYPDFVQLAGYKIVPM